MFVCKNIFKLDLNEMLGRFSDILQTAADVIAPPPTSLQEFEYHWKQVKKFYSTKNNEISKVHVNNTNLPHHLEFMLKILIEEDTETSTAATTEEENESEKCIDYMLRNHLLDLLVELAISETPPGVRVCIFNWVRRFLSCIKKPPLNHVNFFQPIQNILKLCNGTNPSPYEEEEILFLETVAGLVRKDSFLINIFLPSHQHSASVSQLVNRDRVKKIPSKNPLFECTKLETNIRRVEIISDIADEDSDKISTEGCVGDGADNGIDNANDEILSISKSSTNASIRSDIRCDCEDEERFTLMDVILTYFESPDSKVVVRACESALILSSLPDINPNCKALVASLEDFTIYLITKLINLCERIPEDIDPGDIEDSTVAWGLIPREKDNHSFPGKAQLHEFLCWLDYTDCVSRECASQVQSLHSKFRNEFLLGTIEPALIATDTPFVLALMSKVVKQITAPLIMEEMATWLTGDSQSDIYIRNDCLLSIIIENAQDNPEVLVPALQFIETLLDNPHERILHEMIFRYINKRGYYDPSSKECHSWSDEEDERERRRGSAKERIKSRTLAPHNILKVINSFLLLIPRQIMVESTGTCYEEYVQDASRHYKIWIKKTAAFSWPLEAVSVDKDEASSSASPETSTLRRNSSLSESKDPQCNDSGIYEENFYEGPLLKLLFSHVRNMALQPCEINLAVIAILSKLAFLPHPYLHEILLNPEIPVAHGASTLWTSMQVLARQLLLEIPKKENFQKKIGEVGKRLLSNPPVLCDNCDESEPLFEAIVVLEEFCKELAAIAFVKYHHATE